MTFLPIVQRELRVACRPARTYFSRGFLALVIMSLFSFILLFESSGIRLQELGKTLFTTALFICCLYCCFLGVHTTADCISSEKREGTLGFLFLTDLKGYDVILGKLAAKSINPFFSLVGVMPVLAIPLLAGGITLLNFLQGALTLLVAALLSLSVGILCSTFARREQYPGAVTLLVMLLILFIIPVVVNPLIMRGNPEWLLPSMQLLQALSPGYACTLLLTTQAKIPNSLTGSWWLCVSLQFGVSIILLVVASFAVTRVWVERRPIGIRQWISRAYAWLTFGGPERRRRVRETWLDRSPLGWLTMRFWMKPYLPWLFTLLSLVFLILILWGTNTKPWHRDSIPYHMLITILLQVALKSTVASEAGAVFARDFRSGAMELVLTTRLTVREMIRSQFNMLWRLFFKPILFALLLQFMLMGCTWYAMRFSFDLNEVLLLLTFLASFIVLIADTITLAWVGIWTGISARVPKNYHAEAVGRILVMPWLIIGIAALTLVFFSGLLNRRLLPSYPFWLSTWFVLSIATDIYWFRFVKNRLERQFRPLLLVRFSNEKAPTLWSQLGRDFGKFWHSLFK